MLSSEHVCPLWGSDSTVQRGAELDQGLPSSSTQLHTRACAHAHRRGRETEKSQATEPGISILQVPGNVYVSSLAWDQRLSPGKHRTRRIFNGFRFCGFISNFHLSLSKRLTQCLAHHLMFKYFTILLNERLKKYAHPLTP